MGVRVVSLRLLVARVAGSQHDWVFGFLAQQTVCLHSSVQNSPSTPSGRSFMQFAQSSSWKRLAAISTPRCVVGMAGAGFEARCSTAAATASRCAGVTGGSSCPARVRATV
jgi:hypothetical protein